MFGVIEVGSTSTKGYIYDGDIREIPMCSISFKSNYKKESMIIDSDKQKLYNYINEIKKITKDIHIYGTSIFRELNDEEKEAFLNEFKSETGYNFNIVSADLENEYTVFGTINNIDYKGRIAVMIGGGGSTELAILENKKIIEKVNSNFGTIDITHTFPDLKEDKIISRFEDVLNYTKSLFKGAINKSDVLILAGGSYIKFYNTVGYKLNKNTLYTDINQPFMIDIETMKKYDLDFFNYQSLEEIKQKDIANKEWWDGARGMRACVEVISDALNAKYIVPTKITMIYGIVDKIKQEEKGSN